MILISYLWSTVVPCIASRSTRVSVCITSNESEADTRGTRKENPALPERSMLSRAVPPRQRAESGSSIPSSQDFRFCPRTYVGARIKMQPVAPLGALCDEVITRSIEGEPRMTTQSDPCPFCGADMATSGRFCLECGRSIPTAPLPNLDLLDFVEEPERRSGGTGFLRLPGTGRLRWPGDPR
jgi:hypothetical protein